MDLPRERATAKIALIIANDEYNDGNHKRLETPKNDAAKIGNLLKDIGFKVICFVNLAREEMRSAMKVFSQALTEGVYGKLLQICCKKKIYIYIYIVLITI